jgi:hypothetical protein
MRWMWLVVAFALFTTILASAPAKDEQAEAMAILDKALKALGGEEKLAKFNSFTAKGKGIEDPDGKAEFSYIMEISCQAPYRWRVEAKTSAGDKFIRVIDVDTIGTSVTGPTDGLTRREAFRIETCVLTDLGVLELPRFKSKGYRVKFLGTSKMGDQVATAIKVSHDGMRDTEFYFDSATGLPLKRISLRNDQVADVDSSPKVVKVETIFEDYKELSGVNYPTKRTTVRNGRKIDQQEITELKNVEKFDEKTFAKPE